MVNYLYKKYGVLINIFSRKWTRGTSHLKWNIASRLYFWRTLLLGSLLWSGEQTKEGQMHNQFRLVGSKTIKGLRGRKFDPVITERTIHVCHVLGPSATLYRSFLECCTLTKKVMGTLSWDLSKGLRGDKAPILEPSDCEFGLLQPLDLSSRPDGQSLLWQMSLYIFDILFYHLRCLYSYFMASPLLLAVGPRLSLGGLFTNI